MALLDEGRRLVPKVLSIRSVFIEFGILIIQSSRNQHYYGKVMAMRMTYIIAVEKDGVGPCRKLQLRSLQSRCEDFIFCDVFIFRSIKG